jgi:hypothetical protein
MSEENDKVFDLTPPESHENGTRYQLTPTDTDLSMAADRALSDEILKPFNRCY